jgi:3-oxoacyl-[acyl-carrier-protein] synthase II
VNVVRAREAVVTGVGLVTSLAEGGAANRDALLAGARPRTDDAATAPYAIHPGVALDLGKQIPRPGDQRQMEPWQRLGVYAAGLALADAGVAGEPELLARTHMIVAAGGGERDVAVDEAIQSGVRTANDPGVYLNERLSSDLRPTLFLAQLSNLLAGNISIVHGVVGSSRTFMGEEAAGVDALRVLVARVRSGQIDLGLVGGAYSAPRFDMLFNLACVGALWSGPHAPIWARAARGGGMMMGTVGAFLVVEERSHAEARGRRALARLGPIVSTRSRREPGSVGSSCAELWTRVAPAAGEGPLGVLSGATGLAGPTAEERGFLVETARRRPLGVRAAGTLVGHSLEPSAIANVALAALALDAGAFYPPFEQDDLERPLDEAPRRILVTSVGHWRGEGLALVEGAEL